MLLCDARVLYQRHMAYATMAALSYETTGRDVVVMSWPDQAAERDRLHRSDVPRLWLVDPDVGPPIAESCLEDWIRLPASDADLRARLVAVSHRAAHHPTRPTLDEHGLLTYRGVVVPLPRVEHYLATPLITNFGEAVSEHDLLDAARLVDTKEQTLRVHVSRLRRRLAPIGLSITSIRGYGYVMGAEPVEVSFITAARTEEP
jgi:DNA-binding winged helix-turn-helix (wHTH) protein